MNQILKNSEFNLYFNLLFFLSLMILSFFYLFIGKQNVEN